MGKVFFSFINGGTSPLYGRPSRGHPQAGLSYPSGYCLSKSPREPSPSASGRSLSAHNVPTCVGTPFRRADGGPGRKSGNRALPSVALFLPFAGPRVPGSHPLWACRVPSIPSPRMRLSIPSGPEGDPPVHRYCWVWAPGPSSESLWPLPRHQPQQQGHCSQGSPSCSLTTCVSGTHPPHSSVERSVPRPP